MATLTQPGVMLPTTTSVQPRWSYGYVWKPADGMPITSTTKLLPVTVTPTVKYYWS